MSNFTSSSDNNSKLRTDAEISLANDLLKTLLEQSRTFLVGESSEISSDSLEQALRKDDKLTDAEYHAFGASNYFNRRVGAVAGLGTFLVVFGGLRWRSTSRLLKHYGATPSQPKRPLVPPKHMYEIEGKKPAKQSVLNLGKSSTSSEIFSDDVIAQIQFMLVGAVSIVVSSVAARLAFDKHQFLRDIGELPLQPGRSGLCHAVCPAVTEKLRSKFDGTDTTLNNADIQAMVGDPLTIELESMLQFIKNCERRMEYEQERGGSPESPVDVPSPGVPQKYISVVRNEQEL